MLDSGEQFSYILFPEKIRVLLMGTLFQISVEAKKSGELVQLKLAFFRSWWRACSLEDIGSNAPISGSLTLCHRAQKIPREAD